MPNIRGLDLTFTEKTVLKIFLGKTDKPLGRAIAVLGVII